MKQSAEQYSTREERRQAGQALRNRLGRTAQGKFDPKARKFDPVKPSTYPIFFWLEKLLTEDSQLVDVGGSIGLTYYGYHR